VKLTKLKSLCTIKEIINIMKNQAEEWQGIFANHISDKGLAFKIPEEFSQVNSGKKNKTQITQFLTWAKDLARHSLKEDQKLPTGKKRN
jgi:hypothetical protein